MRCKPSFFNAIATSMIVLAIAPPMFAEPLPSLSWKISQQDSSNPLPQTASLIYVAPRPNPSGDGSANNPYSSITAAIATKPVEGTVIQLAQGTYSAETGESFPIKLPAGVTLRGEPTVKGGNTLIQGGGKFISPTFASQNITILAANDARVEGITVTNPNTRGTAVWVESGKRVAIANNTFANSDREGVFLTGTADAMISENLFKKNGANGLSAVGSSKGEIRNNVFENTGFGLAIGQKSRVNVSNNNILNNVDGIIISNLSAPTLRNNLIADSQRNGVVILKDSKGYPTPDLGTSNNLGKNIFRNNLGKDLNNNSGVTQVAVGNELDPKKIVGDIAFVGESPTAPAPQIASTTFVSAAAPTANSIFIGSLPNVPQPVTVPKPSTPSTYLSQNPNEVLIDRDPIPVIPPQPVTPPQSQFIPSNPPQQIVSDASNRYIYCLHGFCSSNPPQQIVTAAPIAPTITPTVQPIPVPYNPQLAALVPPPAIETAPYLVVIPASDQEVLNRVRSAVPTARIIPSRFGNIIMVQGYPDRDRAEVLKAIMRSGLGLDARVMHQNSL